MQLWSITEDTPLVINHVVAIIILLDLMALFFVQYHSFFDHNVTLRKDKQVGRYDNFSGRRRRLFRLRCKTRCYNLSQIVDACFSAPSHEGTVFCQPLPPVVVSVPFFCACALLTPRRKGMFLALESELNRNPSIIMA